MNRITPIAILRCVEIVGPQSVEFRNSGMARFNGPDARLCGALAKYTVDGKPVCLRHMQKYEADNRRAKKDTAEREDGE